MRLELHLRSIDLRYEQASLCEAGLIGYHQIGTLSDKSDQPDIGSDTHRRVHSGGTIVSGVLSSKDPRSKEGGQISLCCRVGQVSCGVPQIRMGHHTYNVVSPFLDYLETI